MEKVDTFSMIYVYIIEIHFFLLPNLVSCFFINLSYPFLCIGLWHDHLYCSSLYFFLIFF